jgi:phenylalanyl-tRNA synthetase beta chain
MKLSLNWLKELIDINMSPSEIDSALTMLGIEVEGIESPAEKFNGFYIAQVNEKSKHPDADKLSVCSVTIGGADIQVICGAPNVEAGQKVVLGTSGAIVPTAGFKLEKRKIRGIESNGMICSQSELGVGEDSGGIWVLPQEAQVGMTLSDYLNINDVIFEISVTPNRADCLSHIGIARELSALTGNKIRVPEVDIKFSDNKISEFVNVVIEDTDKCPRYTAKLVKNCKITESPDWLKSRLQALGLRPINCAVDVTNLILMESGQPLHGFDFDKINDGKIIVKSASNGEKFTTLDGKERILDDSMLLICDSTKPIAIAGVMGGENSEINNNTKNILIESAYFNPSTVRKTSKKLSLQSDSSYRFERGVDYENVSKACQRAANLISELTGGEIVDGIIDVYPNPIPKKIIELRFDRARKIIGSNIDNLTIISLLSSLNFDIIEKSDNKISLSVPTYRVDISLEIDLIEEIARLFNYDNIESEFSSQINFGVQNTKKDLKSPELRNKIRHYLVNKGFTETITQNQIDPKSIELVGLEAVKISNPLGEELSYMRTSLMNSVLKVVNHNIRNGSPNLQIFEIGKIFNSNKNSDSFISGIKENEFLILCLTGNNTPIQWNNTTRNFDFYDIKGQIESALEKIGLKNYMFSVLNGHNLLSKNSLIITYKKKEIGCFGEVKKTILKYYDIDQPVFLAEINLSELYKTEIKSPGYEQISHFPSINRDLAFVLAKEFPAGDVLNSIKESGGEFLENVVLFDVFEGENLGNGLKSLAFSLAFRAKDRTLKENEIEFALNNIINKIENKFSANLRKN